MHMFIRGPLLSPGARVAKFVLSTDPLIALLKVHTEKRWFLVTSFTVRVIPASPAKLKPENTSLIARLVIRVKQVLALVTGQLIHIPPNKNPVAPLLASI